jgi:hypothetical protein
MNTKVNLYEKNPRKIHVKSTRESNVKPRETQKNFKQLITSLEVTPETYKDILNNIKGDADSGFEFSEVVNYSLAYLTNYSFENLKDSEYNLETFKAILDKANINFRLGYKPNILRAYNGTATAKNSELFVHAYCIIQFDYYFKSIDLKNNDFYRYTQHYFNTKTKLDIEQFNGDKEYLLKEYDKMDKDGLHRAKYHIRRAFVGSLFLLLNELELDTIHFKNKLKDCREYNAMTKTPRPFRKYFPFKLVEFDIKSAFPRFIDEIIDSNISSEVYQRIMDSKNMERDSAKIEFNKWLNNGKYKTKEEFYNFFEPIYKEKTNDLVNLLTDKEKPFWKVMFYWEMIAVETFVKINKIEKFTRLHDAVFLIENEYNIPIKNIDFSFVSFGAKKYYSTSGIQVAKDKKTFKYTPAIPYELRSKLVLEVNHTEKIASKSINNFRIYKEPFWFLKANFNIGANGIYKDGEFCFYNAEHFETKLQNMVNVIAYKNNFLSFRKLRFYVKGILNYILENSVITFDLNDVLDYLMISIEPPTYDYKNHTYSGRDNLNIFEYQKEYYKALKMFDTVSYAESIFSIVETSYKTKQKIFIDFRELGLRSNENGKFIFEIIKRFNQANGISDIRTADSFKTIFDKKRDTTHTIKNDTNSMRKNATTPNEIRDFDNITIRPQTKAKFKKWLQTKQDSKEVESIYFELKEFIKKPSSMYKVETINGRNEIVKKEQTQKEQSQIKPFAKGWSELKEIFLTGKEREEFMKHSILNIDETEALQIGGEFYKEWKRYNQTPYTPQTFKISHFKEETKEKIHSLFEYKKGA